MKSKFDNFQNNLDLDINNMDMNLFVNTLKEQMNLDETQRQRVATWISEAGTLSLYAGPHTSACTSTHARNSASDVMGRMVIAPRSPSSLAAVASGVAG